MPYIQDKFRELLKSGEMLPTNPGHLNYLLTELLKTYIGEKGESYQTYNDIVGSLECCKLELYRRKIRPYEDIKIKENGDVYVPSNT